MFNTSEWGAVQPGSQTPSHAAVVEQLGLVF